MCFCWFLSLYLPHTFRCKFLVSFFCNFISANLKTRVGNSQKCSKSLLQRMLKLEPSVPYLLLALNVSTKLYCRQCQQSNTSILLPQYHQQCFKRRKGGLVQKHFRANLKFPRQQSTTDVPEEFPQMKKYLPFLIDFFPQFP